MRVQDIDESRQRTHTECDADTGEDAESGHAVPEAWRNKRLWISVIAAAVILAAGVGFGFGRLMGLGDTVVLTVIPRPTTTASPFIEGDDGIGQDNQTNILDSTAPGMVSESDWCSRSRGRC
jgi:hypothetical protein